MEKFTKGEWVSNALEHDEPYQDLVISGVNKVCTIWIDDAPVDDFNREMIANANLIASAPEMYSEIEQECLELIEFIATLTKYSGDYYYYNNKLLRKQYLLAKARGESCGK